MTITTLYLEGQGDLVRGFLMGRARVAIWLPGLINQVQRAHAGLVISTVLLLPAYEPEMSSIFREPPGAEPG